LRLLLHATRVDSIEGVIVVVARPTHETNTALVAAADVYRARGERHQRGPISPVDRNITQLLGFDDGPDFGVALIDLLGRSLHVDTRRKCADLEPGIHGARLPDEELNALHRDGPESFVREGEIVRTDGHVVDAVIAGRAGLDGSREACLAGNKGDLRTGNQRAAGIGDGAVDVGPVNLSTQCQTKERDDKS